MGQSMKKTTKRAATKSNGHVIVRTYSAGVHYGQLVKRTGKEVELKNARRIWSWQGANTLHEVSLHGVAAGSKISERVPSITLTEAIEVIPCHADAVKALEDARWGK
jgi:hypothetical protein